MKVLTPFMFVLTLIIACGNKRPLPKNNLSSEFNYKMDTTINFEDDVAGRAPGGFSITSTGKPQSLDWKTVDENGNKVAAQLAKNSGDYYNLLVLDNPTYQNLTLSVRIKAVSGSEDQGGGLVWRYLNSNNYYLARYNPLENNFRFYRVVNGNRKQLKSETSKIPSGTWFTLAIEMAGNKVSCQLNGVKLIETVDDTFSKPGRVGLWTKADAVTYFDDLTISTLK